MAIISLSLKADERSESKAQVVVGPVIEINFVTDVEAYSNRASMSFNTATGIENRIHIVVTQTLNGAAKASKTGSPRIEAEISETALNGNEGTERTVSEFEFRAYFPVQDFQISSLKSHLATRGWRVKLLGKSFAE